MVYEAALGWVIERVATKAPSFLLKRFYPLRKLEEGVELALTDVTGGLSSDGFHLLIGLEIDTWSYIDLSIDRLLLNFLISGHSETSPS